MCAGSLTSFVFKDESVCSFLALDMENQKGVLPRTFRTMVNAFSWPDELQEYAQGLGYLQASGSSQFSEEGLLAILDIIGTNKSVVIVDLRQESHGFINGNAIYWYARRNWANVGKIKEQILVDELDSLEALRTENEITVHRILTKLEDGSPGVTRALQFPGGEVLSESDLAAKYNLGYVRFTVTDHIKPDDNVVDEFIELVKKLPDDAWLHFHCKAGKGRTTTFLTLYDMIRNAKNASFEDIVSRQFFIGGNDLMKVPSKDSWKHDSLYERTIFLKQFYDYCRENTDDFATSWSSWANANSTQNMSIDAMD